MSLIGLLANVLMVLGLGTTLGVAYAAWKKRQRPTARALSAIMLLSGGWIGAELVKQLMNTSWSFEILRRVAFAFLVFVVFGYLVFALRYAGYEEYLSPGYLLVLAIHPVVTTLLVFTNHYPNLELVHGLMWQSIPEMGEGQFVRGLMWYVHSVYSYAALLSATALLVYRTQAREDVYREQGAAITAAVLVPLAANAVSISGIFDVPDLTPAGLGITGFAMLWGMRSYGLGEVAPVARENVVQSLQAGILVVDTENAVSETNDRAKELFDVNSDDVIGEQFGEVFSHLPAFRERYADVERVTDEIQVEIDDPRTYEVQVSPVLDGSDARVGRLFMVHDVTDRKRRERELRLQNKQLDQFASLVSHEIQSPLAEVRERVDRSLEHVTPENRGDLLQAKASLEDVDDLVDEVLSMTSQGGAVTPDEADRVSLATAADEAWWTVTEREIPATMSVADLEILADPDRLERILVNLFENAVTYGGTDVTVEVGAIEDGEGGERGFYVEDDGPGIPEDARTAVSTPG